MERASLAELCEQKVSIVLELSICQTLVVYPTIGNCESALICNANLELSVCSVEGFFCRDSASAKAQDEIFIAIYEVEKVERRISAVFRYFSPLWFSFFEQSVPNYCSTSWTILKITIYLKCRITNEGETLSSSSERQHFHAGIHSRCLAGDYPSTSPNKVASDVQL